MEYDLPAGLTRYIKHYLMVERPVLLAGSDHGWLWVGLGGARFGERGIEGMIRRQTRKRFGEASGPHRFRHAAATIAPMADPKQPAAFAAVLGSSKGGRGEDLQHRLQQEAIALRAFGRSRNPGPRH